MKYPPVQVFCVSTYLEAMPATAQAFREWLESAVSMARPHYTLVHRLLVFPEYVTLPLVGETGQVEQAKTVFSEIAIQEQAYLLFCGPTHQDGKLYNEAILMNPLGEVVLQTYKQNLTPHERQLDFQPGPSCTPVAYLPFGNVGVAICFDAFNVTHLAKAGAQIVLQPSANTQPWAARAESSGVWQPLEWSIATVGAVDQVNSPITYLVNPMLRGTWKGLQFDGQSCIVKRAAKLHPCPYVGVDTEFRAEFLYCGSNVKEDHAVGWATLMVED